ncbi:MAG: 50S ribosomal protein L15 [Candidatus Gracilibacteria bacterium]|nr:50S ribosomal protein L15 [Candidatus Gracilibacteria bacterium]
MLSLNTLKADAGARKSSKRLGRGNGSGKGTFSGKGCKGQNARSGGGMPAWFEGGQTPLFRRMPKLKGFSNATFKKEYNLVNLQDLEVLASKGVTEVNKEVLLENGLIRKKDLDVKLLGRGELKAKLTVVVNKASAGAKAAVEKAGGKLDLV